MSANENKSLVILLHGVGSSGSDLAGLGRIFGKQLPAAQFAAPDAPHPGSTGAGRQWFSVVGVTQENRPDRIKAARPSFDALISAIIAEHGLQDDLQRVALVGFSQGTIMALDAVASGRWAFGAVVGFSGRLAAPQPLTPQGATPILLVHGTADPVIPSEETTQAAATLRDLGLPVDVLIEPGVGHTISLTGIEKAGRFLSGILG